MYYAFGAMYNAFTYSNMLSADSKIDDDLVYCDVHLTIELLLERNESKVRSQKKSDIVESLTHKCCTKTQHKCCASGMHLRQKRVKIEFASQMRQI